MEVDQILQKLREQGDCTTLKVPKDWNGKYQPKPYQRVGAAHLAVKKRFILGDVVGSGKTLQSLYAWAIVRDDREGQGQILKLWIVTTKSATQQWSKEIQKFFEGVLVYVLRSEDPPRKRDETHKRWIEDGKSSVLVTNWTQFSSHWSEWQKTAENWLPRTQVIWDEAQKIANPASKAGKTARAVSLLADRVHALTATLIYNRVQDAQVVVEAVEPGTMSGLFFEENYTVKETVKVPMRRGMSVRTREMTKTIGYKNLDDFKRRIGHVYLGRTDAELEGQRPNLVFMQRTTELGADQRKTYLQAEAGVLISEEDWTTTATAMSHAWQAVNNPEIWWDDPTVNIHKTQENAKAKLLLEILEEIGDEPRIIYSPLEKTISCYEKHLKDHRPVRVTGKESGDMRERAKVLFTEGKTDTILITDAGGAALNLQRAKHVIFISRPWSPGAYAQVIGRARRLGSNHDTVTVWHLTALDTLDEFADALLSEKYQPIEEVLQGRGELMPEQYFLPMEIARYARRQRLKEGKRA